MDRRFSVAPMMDCTDRHDRYFLRLISRGALLYTEMVTTAALLHGNRARFLAHDELEHPVALQLGGNDPESMARCARLGAASGFDEINMNVGCPSDRVQSGCFGAALMAEPHTVAACVDAMRASVSVPVTVKTRIGIDDRDSYEALTELVGRVAEAGCQALVVHARKAWLKGLSPKQNRELPPLRYDVVERLKGDFPHLPIVLNGGITDLAAARRHLRTFDGVMMGREAYHNPYGLAALDRELLGLDTPPRTRAEIVEAYLPYVARELARGEALARMTRHLMGLFHGVPGAKRWRRTLSERAHRAGAGIEVVHAALETMAEPAASSRESLAA